MPANNDNSRVNREVSKHICNKTADVEGFNVMYRTI